MSRVRPSARRQHVAARHVHQPDARDVAPRTAEDRLAEYRVTGARALRNAVVEDHQWLAMAIARDYRVGREPLEDLFQVGVVALVKAAERFDPEYGVEFRTYAAVTVRGEIRRYLRDASWAIRVPRRIQELRYEVRAATDVLGERLRRSPSTAEVAEYLHVTVEDVIDCLCADANYRSLSIHDAAGGDRHADALGAPEPWFEAIEDRDAFDAAVGALPPRWRQVVELRYVHQMKQADIGAVVGVSQVHVSRLLRQAGESLRAIISAQHAVG